MGRVDLCTVVDQRTAAHAAVLIAALRRTHPEAGVYALAVDGVSGRALSEAEVLTPADLELGDDSWLAISGSHPDHRADVLAGPLLATVLRRGATSAAYVAVDALVHGPLAELEAALERFDVALAALPASEGEDGVDDRGTVNRRLIAVRDGAFARDLLGGWPRWAEPERDDEEPFDVNAVQRYLDRAAATAGQVGVIDDPGYALNGPTLPDHRVTAAADGALLVDGRPLRHLDLHGFDWDRAHVLPSLPGRPARMAEHPALAPVLEDYAQALVAAGVEKAAGRPAVATHDHRRRPLDVLRRGWARAAHAHGELDTDPATNAGTEQLAAWLSVPATRGSGAGLTRQHELIWESRIDLRGAYPQLDGPDGPGFAGWLGAYGEAQCGLTADELPEGVERPGDAEDSPDDDLAWGVNVAGFFRSELGLGEAARLLVAGLDAASIPALPVQGQLVPPCRQEAEFTFGAPDSAPYPINIVCMNGDAIEPFSREAGKGFFTDRHTIALWWWELQGAFPESWRDAFEHIDEVWVATQHIYDAIAPHSPVPVMKVPMPVTMPRPRAFTRTELGLPEDGFVFLYVYDYHSTSARKNPVGLVKAFRQAFPVGSGAKLVLKCINAENMAEHHDEVLLAIGDDPDITVIDRYVTADEKNGLIAACDCYVSLHRSEGFGLTPAEAMVLGKPVVATRYGGTLDFMTDENSFLVDHGWTTVGPEAHPYPEDARWAEPDLDHAAALMRRVFEDPEEARRRGRRAQRDMADNHSPAAAGAAMRVRLREIYDGMQAAGRTALRVSDLPVPDRSELGGWIESGPPAIAGAGKPVKEPLRKAIGKSLNPWTRHYQRIHGELFAGLTDVEQRLSDASAELDARRREEVAETLAAFRRVRSGLSDHGRWLTTLEGRLEALESRLDPLESTTEQHIAEHRALPYVAEDRAFERWEDDRLGAVEGFRRADGIDERDGYRRFEDAFRGDPARVRALQEAYVGLLGDAGPVLDCGCGRGELLQLLGEAGIEARGVDNDPGMLEVARAAGLDVVERDAVEHLAGLKPGTLGAVVALEVIEHLPEPELLKFFRAAHRALRPGGSLIVETVNPHVVHALKAFWLDPTHQHPLFPETVLELCRQAGFGEGAVFHPTGSGDVALDRYREPAYAVRAVRAVSVE